MEESNLSFLSQHGQEVPKVVKNVMSQHVLRPLQCKVLTVLRIQQATIQGD